MLRVSQFATGAVTSCDSDGAFAFLGLLLYSDRAAKITYRPGTSSTPNSVPISIPPAAAVPMDLLPMAPAPLAIHNGISPATNAKEVMSIGLNLETAAPRAASRIGNPCARR